MIMSPRSSSSATTTTSSEPRGLTHRCVARSEELAHSTLADSLLEGEQARLADLEVQRVEKARGERADDRGEEPPHGQDELNARTFWGGGAGAAAGSGRRRQAPQHQTL